MELLMEQFELLMEQFEKLPGLVNELVAHMVSHPIIGNLDVGITQYSFWMFVAIVILAVVVTMFVKRERTSLVPKSRFVVAMESLTEFVADTMCKSTIGPTWRKHFPFIASLFVFLVINNLLGIIPGCHPGTGAIGTTTALALISFVYFVVVGVREHGGLGYLMSLAPKGVGFPMKILVWLIEVFSTFLRLVTLAIRLFCNLFAGHVVLATFCILVSIFVEPILTQVSIGSVFGAVISVCWFAILLIIYAVEILVAVIQAYVFALLSAVYIQLAEQEE